MPDAAAARAQPRRRRRRHPALVVTVMLLACVVACGLAELAFRILWPLPPFFAEFGQAGMYCAAGVGHVALQPGYRGTLDVDGPTTVSINSAGMRGPELAPKRAGERRVLVVGDSMVWGYGVDAEHALPERLAVALRGGGGAGGLDVTAGNAGVPGYGSKHMAAHLARTFDAFGGDVAVVCGCLGNDATDEQEPDRTVYAGLMLRGPWARLVHASFRARLMYRSRAWLWVEWWLWNNWTAASLLPQLPFRPEEVDPFAGFPTGRTFAGLFLDVENEATTWKPGAPPVIPKLTASLQASLRSCRDTVGLRPLVFVVLPTTWQVLEERRVAKLRELGFDPKDFARGRAQQRWLAAAKELGIVALDPTPILAAEPDPAACYLSDGGHFNARGNDLVARWLASELRPLLGP